MCGCVCVCVCVCVCCLSVADCVCLMRAVMMPSVLYLCYRRISSAIRAEKPDRSAGRQQSRAEIEPLIQGRWRMDGWKLKWNKQLLFSAHKPSSVTLACCYFNQNYFSKFYNTVSLVQHSYLK